MTYGYDAYAHSTAAGIVRINLEGYKTKTGVKTALKRQLERDKIVLIAWVLYGYNGGNKYERNSYEVLDQHNHKAFFEYWGA